MEPEVTTGACMRSNPVEYRSSRGEEVATDARQSNLVEVIKEVRAFTDLGLKEAKELVENSPSVIKSGLSKKEAQQINEKIKAVGAKVIMM